VSVVWVYVDVSDLLCILRNEMECLEFWYFYVGTDVTQVYIVGGDSHMSSCSDRFFEETEEYTVRE
jgi:hypothetical protein